MNLHFIPNLSLIISAAFLTANAYGESSLDARVSQLEIDMNRVRGQTAFENFGAKTAAAYPQIDGYGWFFTGDFLFWKLYGLQTDFVFESRPGSTVFKGDVEHMTFRWRPGYRLSLGYIFDYDGWDVNLIFTDYTTKAKHSERAHGDALLYPLWGASSEAQIMHAKWSVNYWEFDLNLGRNFFLSRFLSFHPSFGLTFAQINQHRSAETFMNAEHLHLRGVNHFQGIGPRMGVDTQFFLGRNFSLYGNVAGALLWGDFDVHEKQASTRTSTVYYDQDGDTHRMAPMINMGIGIAFETNFNNNCNHFLVKVGYEGQYFWRQTQFPLLSDVSFSQQRVSGDLGMQGLTVDFRFDF